MIYRVILQRAVAEEAAIEVDARDADEAERIARFRAADDMVAWTQVHRETDATVEPAR